MTRRPLKPHQQAMLDEFDAGGDFRDIVFRAGYSRQGFAKLLLRYGRTPPSRSAAMKKAWSNPEVRARRSAARSNALGGRICPKQFRVAYKKLRRCGLSRDAALDEVEKMAAAEATTARLKAEVGR